MTNVLKQEVTFSVSFYEARYCIVSNILQKGSHLTTFFLKSAIFFNTIVPLRLDKIYNRYCKYVNLSSPALFAGHLQWNDKFSSLLSATGRVPNDSQ